MYDVVKEAPGRRPGDDVLQRFGVRRGEYVLATVHRAANTDDAGALEAVSADPGQPRASRCLSGSPRTRKAIDGAGLGGTWMGRSLVRPLEHLYVETMALAAGARRVFTDSGGLQKEAFYLGVPCTTLRGETEWVETVELGWNVIVGTDVEKAIATLGLPLPDRRPRIPTETGTPGNGSPRCSTLARPRDLRGSGVGGQRRQLRREAPPGRWRAGRPRRRKSAAGDTRARQAPDLLVGHVSNASPA